MKTKIVYVLVSGEEDFYTEQMVLSIISLRRFHPDAHVVVITDKKTSNYLRDKWSGYQNLITEIKTVDLPAEIQKMPSSRYLKIKSRELIKGNYIYLDNDTLITGDLSTLDTIESDVAGVLNGHQIKKVNSDLLKFLKTTHLKLDTPNLPYYNGGVWFTKDTEKSRLFFKRWFDIWNYNFEKWGIKYDQPSLALANKESGELIKPLPDIYDCQILMSQAKKYLFQAKIYHYYNNLRRSEIFPLNRKEILEEFRKKGLTLRLNQIIENPLDAYLSKCKIFNSQEIIEMNSTLCRIARKISKKYKFPDRILSFLLRLRKKRWSLFMS